MEEFEAVIGLEIHLQVNTKRKAFCDCFVSLDDKPNSNICPVCSGHPGTLPILNREFVNKAVLFSSAIDAEVNSVSTFDRKNYFYPDLPKGYQITQFFNPIGVNGRVPITYRGETKYINIDRVQMEEDSGKSFHLKDRTMIDFNRAGVPLIEIVSKPEIKDGDEASEYFRRVRLIASEYLDVCDGNLENGNMRCDANVSIRRVGADVLNVKTEIKNVNSFAFLKKAIDYEVRRQIEIVESGRTVLPETRRWNSKLNRTELLRKKGGLKDYRYFNEPDLPVLKLDKKFISDVLKKLPELPDKKFKRFKNEYGLGEEHLQLFIRTPFLADFFEDCAKITGSNYPLIANLIAGELLRIGKKESVLNRTITPESFAELIEMIDVKKVSRNRAGELLEIMLDSNMRALEIVENRDVFKKLSLEQIESIIGEVIFEKTEEVSLYRSG